MMKDLQKSLKKYKLGAIKDLAANLEIERHNPESLIYKSYRKINEQSIYNIFNGSISNLGMVMTCYKTGIALLEKYKNYESELVKQINNNK